MGKKAKTPSASKQERALAEKATKEYNHYVEHYKPAELDFIRRVTETGGLKAATRAASVAEVESQIAGLDKETVLAQRTSGARAGSGRDIFALEDVRSIRGEGRGLSGAKAGQAVDDANLQSKVKLSAFGRGLAESSIRNLSDEAQRVTSLNVAKAQMKQAENMALIEGAGAIAGAYIYSRPNKRINPNTGNSLDSPRYNWPTLPSNAR